MPATAPWTDEQVESLNGYQRANVFHPFTCGKRGQESHPWEDEYGDFGVLRATPDGWVCAYCDYTQNWAHDFMINGEWRAGVDAWAFMTTGREQEDVPVVEVTDLLEAFSDPEKAMKALDDDRPT